MGGRAHHHVRRVTLPPSPTEPTDDVLVAEQLALQPLSDRLSRLLGQVAGILHLVSAGTEPNRQLCPLASVRDQLEAARAAFAGFARPRRLAASFRAAGRTLAMLDEILARLERRPATAPGDDREFLRLIERLRVARHQLHAGGALRLGIGIVDFTGACCAFGR